MSDDFTEQDLDTPTEADLDLAYGSKYLSANDVGDRKIRTKILKVGKDKLRGNEGKERLRFVLHLENLDKAMVVNATNKDELTTALGRVPVKWIGATVGLYVDSNVMFAGKRVKGPAPACARPGEDTETGTGSEAASAISKQGTVAGPGRRPGF